MEGTKLGPYRLLEKLGVGGMGTVYRAKAMKNPHSVTPGTQVAVKVIHPHMFEGENYLWHFEREAKLGKSVDHENVVRTLAHGAQKVGNATVHYLVHQYVEGRDLRKLLEKHGCLSEALLLQIAQQAAAGLDAIHVAGIVHRDLKPENVIITKDHRACIMDFGLARPLESRLTAARGSPGYVAPEIENGDQPEPASDQYSLGVLLYELATGEKPSKVNPRLVHEFNSALSDFCGAIVETLLAQKPGDRFDSAAELGRVLREGPEGEWWASHAPGQMRPLSISVRRDVELRGRKAEIATLRSVRETGGVVLIQGQAGIGKTRLVDEFVRKLDKGTRVLYGSYPPLGGLGGLSDAVLGLFGAAGLERRLARYLDPALAEPLAALVRHDALPERLWRGWEETAFYRLACALAADSPTVWIVDDLHFATKESRQLVYWLARAAKDHRFLLVLTARRELPEEEEAHLARLPGFRRIDLQPLPADEIDALLREILGEADARRLGATVARRSDGVPFFVLELARDLKEGRTGTVPSAISDLVNVRLDALGKDERLLLDVASVEGAVFDPELVAGVRKQEILSVLETLDFVGRRLGIVHARGTRYKFEHHLTRDCLYETLSPRRRAEYHTRLADTRAGGNDVEEGEVAYFLAFHHLHGARPKDALPQLEAALTHLRRAYRHDRVVELADLALRDAQPDAERASVLLHKAAALELSKRLDAQKAALEEAVACGSRAEDADLHANALKMLGFYHHEHSEYDRAIELFEQARERAGKELLKAELSGALGNVWRRRGRYQQARACHEEHLRVAMARKARRSEGVARLNLGTARELLGDLEGAAEMYEARLKIALADGDRVGEATALGNLGGLLAKQGRLDDAHDHHQRHLDISREIGHWYGEFLALCNLGITQIALRQVTAGLASLEESITLARDKDNQGGELVSLVNLGELQARMGAKKRAVETLHRSLDMARSPKLEARQREAQALCALSLVLEPAEAEQHLRDAIALEEKIEHLAGEQGARLRLVGLLVSQGRTEEAATEFDALGKVAGGALAIRASAYRVLLTGEEFDGDLTCLEVFDRIEADLVLWKATGVAAYRADARRLVQELRADAPPEYEAAMRSAFAQL